MATSGTYNFSMDIDKSSEATEMIAVRLLLVKSLALQDGL